MKYVGKMQHVFYTMPTATTSGRYNLNYCNRIKGKDY